MPFGKINYTLMIAGVVVVLLGMLVMAMDDSPNGQGVLGRTVSPLILLLGFVIEFFAIFYSPKKSE